MEQWRKDALGALDDTRAEIMAATGETVMTIITMGEADLLGDQPVSFYGNIKFSYLPTFLQYCVDRIAEREAREKTGGAT